MTSANWVFSVTDLACWRGGRLLFRNVSFALEPGDILHITGPNGVGKTSLLRILCGLLPPADGALRWAGADMAAHMTDDPQVQALRCALLLPDDRSLKPAETARETLAFWGAAHGGCDIDAALQRMGLRGLSDMPVRRLSAGQRRRLSLARVFLPPRPLLLLDEPLNALDDGAAILFARALSAHAAAGGMAVVASHTALPPLTAGRVIQMQISGAA